MILSQVEYLCNLTFSNTTNPTKTQVENEITIMKELVKNILENRGINLISIPYEYDRLVALRVATTILNKDVNMEGFVTYLKNLYEELIKEVFQTMIENYFVKEEVDPDLLKMDWDFEHDHY